MGATLGKGSYGHVSVVTTPDGKAYALKAMDKDVLEKRNQVEHVKSERDILSFCDSPFLPYLIGTFQTIKYVYLVQELILGGELYTIIHDKPDITIGVTEARFYGACIVAALSYLHDQLIAHRDLKPENVLIDARGYLKLIDFGFAKVIEEPPTRTFCGTPEYLAPEIVSNKGHGLPVDWWTVGIIVYEMLSKKTPFCNDDVMTMYDSIMKGTIEFGWFFNWDAKNLIKSLCTKDPTERLGTARGPLDPSGKAVREHEFFKSIDFTQLEHQTLPAPYVPRIASATDTSNFEPEESDDESDDDDDDGSFQKISGGGETKPTPSKHSQPFLTDILASNAASDAFADW
uniref:Protein kinase domain-containing protein n=2 Tax=Haptolina brevifila TaxID=156173 RepID=A0A7S2JMW5_9EUKA